MAPRTTEEKEAIIAKTLEGWSNKEILKYCRENLKDSEGNRSTIPDSTLRSIRKNYLDKNANGKWCSRAEKPFTDVLGQCKSNVLDEFVESLLPCLHKKRRKIVRDLVAAAVDSDRLRASDMSRALAANRNSLTTTALRCVGAFTRNEMIDVRDISRKLFRRMTQGSTRILLGIDWTDFSPNDQVTLQLFVIVGRNQGIPLFFKTVPKSEFEKTPKKETVDELLDQLVAAWSGCPDIKAVVLTGDREFGTVPMMEACAIRGIDFCLRKHPRSIINKGRRQWSEERIRKGDAATRVTDATCTAARYKVKTVAMFWDRGMKEPWIILSSLDLPAPQLITLYSLRWSIESNFKADKDENSGMGFGKTYFYGEKDESCERRDRMWVIDAMVALYFLALGRAAEVLDFERVFCTRRAEAVAALGRRCKQQKKKIVHNEFSLRRKGKEMQSWWVGRVLKLAEEQHPTPGSHQRRPTNPTFLRQLEQRLFAGGYRLKHQDEIIEVFDLGLHILRQPSTFIHVNYEGAWQRR